MNIPQCININLYTYLMNILKRIPIAYPATRDGLLGFFPVASLLNLLASCSDNLIVWTTSLLPVLHKLLT